MTVLSNAALAVVVVVLVLTGGLIYCLRSWRPFGNDADVATYTALNIMAQASLTLREPLCAASATAAAPYLREMLHGMAVVLTNDKADMLAWDSKAEQDADAKHHSNWVVGAVHAVLETGRQQIRHQRDMDCGRGNCPVRSVVVSPLQVDGGIVGTLGVISQRAAGAKMIRATQSVARYVSSQLELAELDESRARLAHAEIRALRSQISPHFIYNALTTISHCVKTDPEQARELIMEFSDFTRYSFRADAEFTTLAEELNNIDRYLILEKARFGERLQVKVQIAPEVLPVVLPFLALQPLVENAVRHGLGGKDDGGTLSIIAEDAGADCVISVEDDGIGMDPDRLREEMTDSHLTGAHVGLGNVHDRLRGAFGDECGLVVETGPGMGTKVSMKVPKFSRGVRAIAPPTPGSPRSQPSVSA
ncbi:MAG: histidine kinase [Pseudonocardiales bacterium]|nr:histidine kinase [Pseudonocardiales bacterium]